VKRSLQAPAVLAMVALVAAGCSNGSADGGNTGVGSATTGTRAGTGSSATGNNVTRHAKAVRFAECMRTNGVSAFPDPDASGELTIDGVVNGSSLDPSSAAWKQAVRVCRDLEPPGFTGSKANPQQMSARLKFAQCIRDNGVKDFPDPTRDGPLVDTNRIPSSATKGGMSILDAAMEKCRSFAYEAGVRGSQ
jgi:hypothetical protein